MITFLPMTLFYQSTLIMEMCYYLFIIWLGGGGVMEWSGLGWVGFCLVEKKNSKIVVEKFSYAVHPNHHHKGTKILT